MTRAAAVTAIADAAGASEPRAERTEQLAMDLEPLPPTSIPQGTEAHAVFAERVRQNRAGRPPGARNLATARRIELVTRLFGDPFVESARWLAHTADTLARELHCTRLEAFDRLEEIRRDLRRYVHAPRAAEDGRGNVIPPTFTLAIGGQTPGADGPPPWAYLDQQPQQNQALVPPAPAVSDGAASDGEAK